MVDFADVITSTAVNAWNSTAPMILDGWLVVSATGQVTCTVNGAPCGVSYITPAIKSAAQQSPRGIPAHVFVLPAQRINIVFG